MDGGAFTGLSQSSHSLPTSVVFLVLLYPDMLHYCSMCCSLCCVTVSWSMNASLAVTR